METNHVEPEGSALRVVKVAFDGRITNRRLAEASASRFATKVALANILHGSAVRFSPPAES